MPEGSSAGKIQKDDLLLQANGQSISTLAILEDLIDEATESSMTVLVRRQSRDHEISLDVKVLFILVPYRILEYAGCLFQDLAYEVAIERDLPLKGVVLSSASGCSNLNVDCDVMITSLDNRLTPDLETFIEIAQGVSGEQRTWI